MQSQMSCHYSIAVLFINDVKNVPVNNVKNYVPINPLTAEWAVWALIDFYSV